MTIEAKESLQPTEATILGPFLGYVTPTSIKVWLHLERDINTVYVSVHLEGVSAPIATSVALSILPEQLDTGCITIEGLQPDSKYYYKLWQDVALSVPLDLEGITPAELHFYTLSNNPNEQVDFLIMSCHNPTVSGEDGYDGHALWADIPQIIGTDSNKKIRFALLVGDQVYADDWQDLLLAEKDSDKRQRLYLSVYRRFWSNIHYRRVLCSVPAMMMWDDHDITDGWGSTTESFDGNSSEFKAEWKYLFDAASFAFGEMQAARNPAPLASDRKDGYDCCFTIGKLGFILLDLRTHRNLRKQVLMAPEQISRIKNWVNLNKQNIQTLFVVSPVVFSHGSPVLDEFTVAAWPFVRRVVDWVASKANWGKGLQANFTKTLGDISDDIRDSWGVKENANAAEQILDFFFNLQNDTKNELTVVILSGDIHTSGYATLYSRDPRHVRRSSIPHITSSSVSYKPFNWLVEAVYRNASKSVELGATGKYSSQISHHFCYRSVAVLSVRQRESNSPLLKVKYYLEGFPEPQILQFDLSKASHRENIVWGAQDKVSVKKYAPLAEINLDELMSERAKKEAAPLNINESIVDLLKALDMESDLGSRKQLAREFGYEGAMDGSREMNIWLLREVKRRLH